MNPLTESPKNDPGATRPLPLGLTPLARRTPRSHISVEQLPWARAVGMDMGKTSARLLLKQLAACRQLLGYHACGRDHGKAPVVELLGLHLHEFLFIFRLEAKRVEIEISWEAVGLHLPLPVP